MLVELGLVEQRYKAVSEVLVGATVVDVAQRGRAPDGARLAAAVREKRLGRAG